MAVAGILENNDSLGAASGFRAVVDSYLGLEVVACDGLGRRDGLLWKLGRNTPEGGSP